MSVGLSSASLSQSKRPVRPGAIDDSLLSSSRKFENRKAWASIIDFKLIEWGYNPGRFDAEEIDPPTAEAIHAAMEFATALRDSGACPAADWVVPTGDGGIAFQWGDAKDSLFTAEFTASGGFHFSQIEGFRTVS
jgi:hypothetical protein